MCVHMCASIYGVSDLLSGTNMFVCSCICIKSLEVLLCFLVLTSLVFVKLFLLRMPSAIKSVNKFLLRHFCVIYL